MRPHDIIGRLVQYVRRHGFGATLQRLWLALRRTFNGNRLVLFYCDLAAFHGASFDDPETKVERKTARTGLADRDLARIISVGYVGAVQAQISKRFAQGATLWLFKAEGQLAAYGWSLAGRTVEPHFFPLGKDDVHLFDFYVFPDYRGRRINVALVTFILKTLGSEKKARAFIEAAEWNTPQLQSLSRMPFQKLGTARKLRLLGRTVAVWSEGQHDSAGLNL